MKKTRGRETLCTKARIKRLSALLRDGNTIVTVCHAEGIGERTYFDWCERYPAFAAAMRKARAAARIRLVRIVRKAAISNAFHAQWLLERVYAKEFARTETRIIEQKAEEPRPSVQIWYDCGGETMEQLLDFPKMGDPPEIVAAKQARLLGQPVETPSEAREEATEEVDRPESEISDAPKVVDKRLTGRLRPEWKNPNGQP
jgi:hypothetical protein